jgi:Plectin/S10 domain
MYVLSKLPDAIQTDQNARLIPKADRKAIHEYLFREGVLVAQKDYNLPKHREIDTKNLYVCQSGHVTHPADPSVLVVLTPSRTRSSKRANPSPHAATSKPSSPGNGTTTPSHLKVSIISESGFICRPRSSLLPTSSNSGPTRLLGA